MTTKELELGTEGANAWAEATGNNIEVISTPNSTTERLALHQQIIATDSSDIDVLQIDVIWPGILQIEHPLDRRPNQFSGGQRQRVAIGRAIVRDSHVFLDIALPRTLAN